MYTGPRIVQSGLILCLDANSTRSYPGTGTTWFDLSGNGYNGTLNSVTYQTSGNAGKVMSMSGSTSSYIDIPSPNLASSNYTVFTAARYNGAARERIVNAKNNNWLIGHWSSTTENYYAEGWISGIDVGANDTNWRVYHATGHYTNDLYGHYVNTTQATVASSNGQQGPNGFLLGKYNIGNSEASNGEVSFLVVYDRVLSTDEILQNYNAVAYRFANYV